MSYEINTDNRFQMATFYQSGFKGESPLKVEIAIPRPEYYADEIIRLSNKALREAAIVSRVWDDSFGTVLIMREVQVPSSVSTRWVYDWRDGSSDSDGRPISIDSVVIRSPNKNIDGKPNTPLEFYRYCPDRDELCVAKMEDITEDDLADKSFMERLELEFSLPTIVPTLKDRMVFYSDLLRATGESPTYNYET